MTNDAQQIIQEMITNLSNIWNHVTPLLIVGWNSVPNAVTFDNNDSHVN